MYTSKSLPNRRVVLFKDGTCAALVVHPIHGACLVGQPTAYVLRHRKPDQDGGIHTFEYTEVRPGESVEFVEA